MTLEMIGTQSIHPDYSNLHNIVGYRRSFTTSCSFLKYGPQPCLSNPLTLYLFIYRAY